MSNAIQGQWPKVVLASIGDTHGLPMKAMLLQSNVMMDMPERQYLRCETLLHESCRHVPKPEV